MWRNGSVIPHLLNLRIRWQWVVSFLPRPLNSRGKSLCTHWLGDWVSRRAGLNTMEKSLSFRGIEPWVLGCPAVAYLLFRLDYAGITGWMVVTMIMLLRDICYEICKVVIVRILVVWVVTPCSLLGWYRCFRETCFLYLHPWRLKQHVPPKHRCLRTRLHGVTTQKTWIWMTEVIGTNLHGIFFETVKGETLSYLK
jgi:hypothetical protein